MPLLHSPKSNGIVVPRHCGAVFFWACGTTMIDLHDTDDLKHLHECVEASWDANTEAREQRDQIVSDYSGTHYPDANEPERKKELTVNFIELATSVYRRELVSANPRVYATTRYKDLRGYCETVENAINWRIEQMALREELDSLATDALLGPMGIMKVGRDVYRTYEHEGQTIGLHKTFAKTVDFADFVYDVTARKYKEAAFVGNLVRMREDAFKDSPIFTDEMKDSILASELARYRSDGTSGIKADGPDGGSARHTSYSKFVEFWDLWLPREKRVVWLPKTLPEDFDKPLRNVPWKGPVIGPYHTLGFGPVPGNILPMSPIGVLSDLNDLLNDLFGKMEEQSLRQKKNPIFRSGDDDDMQRLVDAEDGQPVRMDSDWKEMTSGGLDQVNMYMFLEVKKLIEYLGGGLPILAGLGTMSDTLGQDRLLAAASSKRMADMQSRMVAVVRDICESIAFYEWQDPRSDPPLVKELPGGVMRKLSFAPEHRRGEFHQYSIQLHPYSLREQSPIERVTSLDRFVQTQIMPMLPELPKHGMAFNFKEYVDIRARMLDTPELKEVIMFDESGDTEQQRPQGRSEVRQAPVTERINTRVNRNPGMESDDALMAKMLTGMGQPQGQGNA